MSKKSCDRDHHTIFISREDRRSLRDREKTIADPDRDQKIGDQSCLATLNLPKRGLTLLDIFFGWIL